jgi:DNA replication and repair protein RecF
VRVDRLELVDFRNIREAKLDLSPGLNIFVGQNAQGKTSLLEAVGLLARGRSFRTEETRSLIRRGAAQLRVRATAHSGTETSDLEVQVTTETRRLFVDGRETTPRSYQGRLDAVVYATDRLRVVHGPMRERRQFLDRSASALWPAYRQILREYERVVRQRNAALDTGGPGLEPWDEALAVSGVRLRLRRGDYVARLSQALAKGFHAAGETYAVAIDPAPPADEAAGAEAVRREIEARRRDERRARRSLVGPHRDTITFSIDGVDASSAASAGQARSLLLALTLATLEVYRAERGRAPLALLDDLDSELDDQRAGALCRAIAGRGQALVTTAHNGWASRVASGARTFHVADGSFAEA